MDGLASKIGKNLRRAVREPAVVLRYGMAFAKGAFLIGWYRLFRPNVRIGFPFLAYAKVTIRGPGAVTIGRGCNVFNNVYRGLTIVTFSEAATVTIGDSCALGGLTVRSHDRVTIGSGTMTAYSLVQDAPFSDMAKAKSAAGDALTPPSPVEVGENVWLGGYSIVLGGSRIGNDCVLGACSVSRAIEIEEYRLGSGNPVKRGFPIPQLLGMRK